MTKEEVTSFLLLVSALTIGLTDASIFTSTPPSIFNFTPSHNISLTWTYNRLVVLPFVTQLAKWDAGSSSWSPLVVHVWIASITSVYPTANVGRLDFVLPFTFTFTPTLASDVGTYKMTVTNNEGNPPKPTQHVSIIELRIAAIASESSSNQLSSSAASLMNDEIISSSKIETFSTTSTPSQEPIISLTTSPSIAATLASQNTILLASSTTQSILEASRSSHESMSGSLGVDSPSSPTTGQVISTESQMTGSLIVTASSLFANGQAISTESYATTHKLLATSQTREFNTISTYPMLVKPTKSDVLTLKNNSGTEWQTTITRSLIVTTSRVSSYIQLISTKTYTTTWEPRKTSQIKQPNTVPVPINPASINTSSMSSKGATFFQIITSRPATDSKVVTWSQTTATYPKFQSTTLWLRSNRTIISRPVTESNRAPFSWTTTPWLQSNGISTTNGSLYNSITISATKMYPFHSTSHSVIYKNASTGGTRHKNEKAVIGLSIGLPLLAFVLFAGAAYAYIVKMKMINKTYPRNAINMTDFVGSNEVKANKYIAVGEEQVISDGIDSATSGDLFHCKRENIQV